MIFRGTQIRGQTDHPNRLEQAMVEKHDRPVFCPRCRIAMVWVDADADGFNRYSCPNCGGVAEFGPESSNCLLKWSVSSRIVGDIFAHPRVHAPGIVESHRNPSATKVAG
jgi:hypothetical protein